MGELIQTICKEDAHYWGNGLLSLSFAFMLFLIFLFISEEYGGKNEMP